MIALGAGCSTASALTGIHKIQHVIVLMQENRSFDQYFGTYPGADGIPAGVCEPDPVHGGCVAPFHDPADINYGGPHHVFAYQADVDGGRMDGFIKEAEQSQGCTGNPNAAGCSPCNAAMATCLDVMGYHDAREIPNYWSYAENYVLQDHLFEPVRAWSWPAHLYEVSGWSAQCLKPTDPMSCSTFINQPPNGSVSATSLPWTDITYLLHKDGVSWGYYVFQGNEPDCESDAAVTCSPVAQGPTTPGIWNPLLYFNDVKQDNQTGNIQSLSSFYRAAGATPSCGLPQVSWIVPNAKVSEHPPSSVSAGQTYVTSTINAVMRSPCWNSTAIFLSWDDWGGFYDHVVPPTVPGELASNPTTAVGYGIRVPGLVISPYSRTGYIDHQTLSHDAYLKFIEDDFLGGQRIDPATDGRPDSRPDVREDSPLLGDLVNDFDFNQLPRAPILLPVHPAPGPASCAPGGCTTPVPPPAFQLTVSVSRNQRLTGRHPSIALTVSCNLACGNRLTGTLSIKLHRRHLKLQAKSVHVAAGSEATVRFRPTRQLLASIRTQFRHHRKLTVTIYLTATAGSVTRRYHVTIRLRP